MSPTLHPFGSARPTAARGLEIAGVRRGFQSFAQRWYRGRPEILGKRPLAVV